MRADRFFSLSYDIRHNPKIDILRESQGGLVAFGRWVALMTILYDVGGVFDMSPTANKRYLMRELEFNSGDELQSYLVDCCDCGLLSAELLNIGHVVSPGICEQIEYYNEKAEQSKRAAESRWSNKKQTKKKAD